MNRETYLETVVKNLLCSNKEKKRIYKDLQSDIEAAIENGESWISVQERLGTPEELAMEFNENLDVKKKIDKKWIVAGVLLCIIVVVAICVSFFSDSDSKESADQIPQSSEIQDSKVFKEETLKTYANEIVQLLSQKEFEQLKSYLHTDLQVALNEESLDIAMKQLGELGTYQKITNQRFVEITDKGQIMAVGEVVALYEMRSVTYTITFDKEMKVIGLYMR